MPNKIKIVTFYVGAMLLSACGGGGGGGKDDDESPSVTYSIGGTVSGLANGATLTLQNNSGNSLAVSTSGPFTFSNELQSDAAYSVTVAAQPSGQSCSVANGSGTVASQDITNVAVTCSTQLDPNAASVLSPTHKPTLVGIVIDSPVINLHYDAPVLDGTTNAQGQFEYLPGDLIKFKVGDVELPPVIGRPVITVLDFAATPDINNTVVVNIARFLQSLDSDGNVNNGITISAQAHSAAAGQTLDFSSANFDSAANPIIAAAGGVNSSLISASAATANLQAALSALPKLVPIAGAYMTGTGAATRGIVLLENGFYYGMEANCGGSPNYEFGTYTYNGTELVLSVSNNANGACGLNTGAHAAAVSGSSLALGGQNWTEVSTTGGLMSGLYLDSGVLEDPARGSAYFNLTLFTDTQYINLDATCDLHDGAVETGTYSLTPDSFGFLRFDVVSQADSQPSCGVASAFAGGSFSVVNYPGLPYPLVILSSQATLTLHVAYQVNPARQEQSLTGVWLFPALTPIGKAAGSVTFTGDGRMLLADNEELDCRDDGVEVTNGERGTYVWDSASGQINVTVINDANGDCGFAGGDETVTSVRVTGNLLTAKLNDGTSDSEIVLLRGYLGNGIYDVWNRAPTQSAPLLTLGINVRTSPISANEAALATHDSDCPATPTTYPLEYLDVTLASPNGIAPSATPIVAPLDIPGCGLPTTVGPTYLLNGDQLTIDGLGTFERIR